MYTNTTFDDVWFSTNDGVRTDHAECSFVPKEQKPSCDLQPTQYFVNITNLKNEYDRTESPRFNVFTVNRSYDPATITSASSGPNGLIITNAYYQVQNDRTDKIVVPFGTGSAETTRLSYDTHGNYFKFYMSSLPSGNVYRIVFLFDVDGQKQLIDNNFKFRVL